MGVTRLGDDGLLMELVWELPKLGGGLDGACAVKEVRIGGRRPSLKKRMSVPSGRGREPSWA